MKFRLRNLFSSGTPVDRGPSLELSVAQLLLEIARTDSHIGEEELRIIRSHLAAAYDLDPTQLEHLMDQARTHVEQSVSLHETVRRINQACGAEEKTRLIGALWQVAYADRRLDAYEEALLRRLADLLYVPHSAFIREKLGAQG